MTDAAPQGRPRLILRAERGADGAWVLVKREVSADGGQGVAVDPLNWMAAGVAHLRGVVTIDGPTVELAPDANDVARGIAAAYLVGWAAGAGAEGDA